MAMVTGLLISLFTMGSDGGSAEPHIFAILLTLTGIGLRVEAAINESRA
ncbi:hypothetical protein ACFP2T_41615 [Plantactinospora solaniradicis]|uniref:Uncharacterized protein n=1 Tax=Plantactinospora solaniradicis TaxID=1723736 RepID=A0ABW1KM54_9ACTN